jgi:hypothetical protein
MAEVIAPWVSKEAFTQFQTAISEQVRSLQTTIRITQRHTEQVDRSLCQSEVLIFGMRTSPAQALRNAQQVIQQAANRAELHSPADRIVSATLLGRPTQAGRRNLAFKPFARHLHLDSQTLHLD